MLLHYSFVLLSFMRCLISLSFMGCLILLSFRSCLIVLSLTSCLIFLLSFRSCLIVLSFMSCLISLSFMSYLISLSYHGCLITLALVVFWVRHIPQECTTFSDRSLRWVCLIALGIWSPWHVHWHTVHTVHTVIAFLFLILLFLHLSWRIFNRRAVPLRFILICSCSRSKVVRCISFIRFTPRRNIGLFPVVRKHSRNKTLVDNIAQWFLKYIEWQA